ncbi:MAG: hypothetical protein HY695_24605 [Deltaproteobacteria bacterium]|nr:hypothetical protein [Deltaproteobacteria bacterium]
MRKHLRQRFLRFLKEADTNFLLFLPESTRVAIIDAKDVAMALDDLGYNVPHLIRVFESFKEKCYLRTALGEMRLPHG